MLWTLLKVLIFFTLVAALAFGAEFLVKSSDSITLVFLGTEYILSPIVAVLVLALLMLAFWIILRLAGLLVAILRFINGDETALSRYFDRNREHRGFRALTEGMMALASGEPERAITKARSAERLLAKPELTDLLIAQAAEAAGDKKQATNTYKRLLDNAQTRFVGVHGLMKQKLKEGDTETALKLAQKAFALKPKHGETQDTLLRLQAAEADWTAARKTLTAKLKAGTLPKDVHRRRYALLSLATAQTALAEGDTDQARTEAFEANRLSPELVPGAVLAARMHSEAGNPRKASNVLKTAWQTEPHPDLAAAYADIKPNETPKARLKRFEPLLKLRPEDSETKLLSAELHLAAQDTTGARTALGDLAENAPTARSLTIMAALEKSEGAEDHVVRAWLARAATAPRGPAWVCSNCGSTTTDWRPVCENCEAFDTLNWTTPKGSRNSGHPELLTGAMMPLLVDHAPAAPETSPIEDALKETESAPSPDPNTLETDKS